MKKFFISAAVAVNLATPALAADMAVKAPPPAPVPTMYNWSGFYIGANGGWADNHNCWDFGRAVGTVFGEGCNDRSGAVAGGQIGYRWQANQFVFGLEAQGDWADLRRTQVSLLNPTLSTQIKTDAIGLFTGQIGWAWNAALFYVKGGAAVTDNRFNVFDNGTGVTLASASATRWGGTVGVGFEYGFAPNWSIGAEYDHLFMGNTTNSFTTADPRLTGFVNDRVSQDVDMLTLRINYRFGAWGAPPVSARY
jgi:outer membrane immunogenic protein